jgi:metal-sulfur cluster biosynthetic enzyme
VNIYELGLIYNMDVDSASNVYIRMTLTAPGCPSAQQIPLDVSARARSGRADDVKVEVVWIRPGRKTACPTPPSSPSAMF